MKTKLAVVVLGAVVATGCVSQGKYDRAVAETQTTRAELGKRNVELEQANAALSSQRDEIVALEKQLDQLMSAAYASGATKTAQIDELKKRLDDLRTAHSAAEARAVMFRDLARRLSKEIDAGDLRIVLRDQRMVLQLPDDVLFDSGKAALKPAGKRTLDAVAAALGSLSKRHFQVAGHTDNEPIKKSPYASNWELSSARSLTVVHYLLGQGLPDASLSAAGYGEVDPIASNATPEGRQKNRRTEITIQPSIDEIVHVP